MKMKTPTVEYVGKSYILIDYRTFNFLSAQAYANLNTLMNNAYRESLGTTGKQWEEQMNIVHEFTQKIWKAYSEELESTV